MTRLIRVVLSAFVAAWAIYGVVWFFMAETVVETVCRNRLAIVRLDAEDAEAQGNWLNAAHLYAHLIEYDQDSIKGCSSAVLNDKSKFLPFALMLIEVRWGSPIGKPTLDSKQARQAYERAVMNSRVNADFKQKRDTDALAHQ